MGIRKEVKEVLAYWNEKWKDGAFKDQDVMPDPKYVELLETKSVGEIFQMWFPVDSQYMVKPEEIKELEWNNHLNALIGMICELK